MTDVVIIPNRFDALRLSLGEFRRGCDIGSDVCSDETAS